MSIGVNVVFINHRMKMKILNGIAKNLVMNGISF